MFFSLNPHTFEISVFINYVFTNSGKQLQTEMYCQNLWILRSLERGKEKKIKGGMERAACCMSQSQALLTETESSNLIGLE